MTVTDEVLRANEAYARQFTLGQLPMPPARTSLANFFSPLVNGAEKMFLTGRPTYPVERTLLTTGLTAAGVESLYRKQRFDTPHLQISYQPTKESTYWRT